MPVNVTYMQFFRRGFAFLGRLLWHRLAFLFPHEAVMRRNFSAMRVESSETYCPNAGSVAPITIMCANQRLALMGKNNLSTSAFSRALCSAREGYNQKEIRYIWRVV